MESLRLASVKEAFQEWRMHRSSCVEAIPEALWTMATSLYPHHKRSTICQQLRLSGSQLKQRIEGAVGRLAESGFVLASRDGVEANSKLTSEIQLTIKGQTRSLTFCVDMNALSQILPHLSALL